jgi:hypothetical protein
MVTAMTSLLSIFTLLAAGIAQGTSAMTSPGLFCALLAASRSKQYLFSTFSHKKNLKIPF